MWVRAQVDYLQRLPNDREKRSALKELPPDLPQTYIRIFESIQITFPEKTTRYIQRLLRWLVYCETGRNVKNQNYCAMSFDELRQIICTENDHDWPTNEDLPVVDQLHHWLGCLVRITKSGNKSWIELSHFTVKEFLTMNRDNVSRLEVQQYLVDRSHWTYLADDCMTYLTHSHFRNTELSTLDEIRAFLSNHHFYAYVATTLYEHLSWYNTDMEPTSAIQQFFSVPLSTEFMLWLTCSTFLDAKAILEDAEFDINAELRERFLSPLHFAAIAGLKNQIRHLLVENVIPSVPAQTEHLDVSPLHVAIAISNEAGFFVRNGCLELYLEWCNEFMEDQRLLQRYQRSLEVTTLLVESGAHINQQLVIFQHFLQMKHLRVTPLVLSLLCKNLRVANFLLDVGADWDAIAESD